MNYVQSYICNLSFPKTLDEVLYYMNEEEIFNIERILNKEDVEWTSPKWCKTDDIVFFMHSKTSNNILRKLKKDLLNHTEDFSPDDYATIKDGLERGSNLYELYGGKIFAIGKVNGNLVRDDNFATDNNLHWKSRIYAPVDEIHILRRPIDLSEFNSFISISRQSCITPVFGDTFTNLKTLIMKYNEVPMYFSESIAASIPLSKITIENWITLSNLYRRSFFLEIQFRTFYTNYLLKEIGDIKNIYSECACYKKETNPSFVDNVIYINGKYLPIEIKLHSSSEKDIIMQIQKYCNLKKLVIDSKNNRVIYSKDIYNNFVILVDTFSVFLYSDLSHSLTEIFKLDNIKSKDDIQLLKKTILSFIN